jgi:hypothetical protein
MGADWEQQVAPNGAERALNRAELRSSAPASMQVSAESQVSGVWTVR